MHCQNSLNGPGTVLNGFPSKQAYKKTRTIIRNHSWNSTTFTHLPSPKKRLYSFLKRIHFIGIRLLQNLVNRRNLVFKILSLDGSNLALWRRMKLSVSLSCFLPLKRKLVMQFLLRVQACWLFSLSLSKMGESETFTSLVLQSSFKCLTLSGGNTDVQSTLGKIFNVLSTDTRRARGIHITIANLTNQLNQLSQWHHHFHQVKERGLGVSNKKLASILIEPSLINFLGFMLWPRWIHVSF